jgi:ribosomal protein S18 acetylase RimI-like enzyme
LNKKENKFLDSFLMAEDLEIKKGSRILINENIESLKAIDKNCFSELSWNEDAFISELPSKFESSLLLFSEKQLVGYGIVSKKEGAFHLHKFVINPNLKSKGLGKLLMDSLLEHINYQSLTLKVEVSNIDAIIFYLKKKFIFTEKSGDYYHMLYNGK